MTQEPTSLDWVELVERFGVSFAIITFLGVCIWKVGQFIKPILRDYIERRIAADEKRADAAVESAKAASDNALMLAKTAEKSIEVQKDNAQTNRNLLKALETLMSRIDHIAFPPKK